MPRTLVFAIMTVAALGGCASSVTDVEQASFCHGYIQKGLGEYPVDGLDRNAMWLSWNAVVPLTVYEGQKEPDSYQRGRDTFGRQLAANDVGAMEEVMDNDCDQGENSTWRWW